MVFQAEVGTWTAAHIMARLPIGSRFRLIPTTLPETIRIEIGEGLVDMLVTLDGGGRIDLQSKTRASLSRHSDGSLGKTIAQLVRTVIAARAAGRAIDPLKARAVLAVCGPGARRATGNSPGKLLDLPGVWL